MNETLDELYAAIVENPQEDTPRLMYADRMDETLDPADPEHEHKAAHAELIRTQVAAYNLPFCERCYNTGRTFTLRGAPRKPCTKCDRGPAYVKCRKLLRERHPFVGKPSAVKKRNHSNTFGSLADYLCRRIPFNNFLQGVEVRRGFIDSVTMPQLAFADPRGPGLDQYRETNHTTTTDGRPTHRECYAVRLFRALPLTSVYLSDVDPFDPDEEYHREDAVNGDVEKYGYGWMPVYWNGEGQSFSNYPAYTLVPKLFSALQLVYNLCVLNAKGNVTLRDRRTWLEWACVYFGRELAGHPTILPSELNPYMPYSTRYTLSDYTDPDL